MPRTTRSPAACEPTRTPSRSGSSPRTVRSPTSPAPPAPWSSPRPSATVSIPARRRRIAHGLDGVATKYPGGKQSQKRREVPMATEISERQSREVAEAAREAGWELPSFGRELFLGNLRLDLIHPQPKLDPQAVERGDRFLADLRAFLESDVDPLEIEREAKIPGSVLDGLKELGALGMKVPEEYGGLGLSQ